MDINTQLNDKSGWKRLPKWTRVGVWIIGSVVALLFLAFGLVTWYVNNNKESLIKQINEAVQEKVDGNFSIGDLDVTLFKNFPNIAIRLNDVSLSDSLYHKHNINLLELEHIY